MNEPLDEAATRREMIHRLNTLAWYIRAGLPLDWVDPQPRGRKNNDREHLTFSWTVRNVHAFNDISWRLIKRDMKRR